MKKLIPILFILLALATLKGMGAEETGHLAEADATPDYQRIWAGLDLQYVPATFPHYTFASGLTTEQSALGFRLAAEMVAIDAIFGKVGLGLGAGFFNVADISSDTGNASLQLIPVDVSLSYRMDIFQNQVLVPFVKIGTTRTSILSRQPEWGNKNETALTADMTFGAELLLDVLDRSSASSLNHRIGIRNTFLLFEYHRARFLQSSTQANLTSDQIRMGLRFEM